MRKSDGIQTTIKREKKKTKKAWLETIRNNWTISKLTDGITLNRTKWRYMINKATLLVGKCYDGGGDDDICIPRK